MKKTISIAGVRILADKFYGKILPAVKYGFLRNLGLKVEAALLEPNMERRKAMLCRAEQLRMLKELTEGALMLEKMSPKIIKFPERSWRRWRKFFEGILDELSRDIDRIIKPAFRNARKKRRKGTARR